MTCYCDNDIVHKVSAFDLFAEMRVTLALQPTDLVVLSTARFKFGLNKDPAKGETRYGRAVFARIRAEINGARALTQGINPADEPLLADVLGIDAGEALLFSAASWDATSILITGDKRSLHALLDEPKCSPIATRLAGRVYCLETLVKMMIAGHGFTAVRGKIVPAYDCDTAIRAAFGSGLASVEGEVTAALNAYAAEFARHAVRLLK